VALVAVTAATGLGLVVAEDARYAADRTPEERRLAGVLSDRLVAPGGTHAVRANALDRERFTRLNATDVVALAPPLRGHAFAVSLGNTTIASRGDPAGGTTVRRLVLVGERRAATRTVALDEAATVPRSDRITVSLRPDGNTSVVAVRVDGRVVRRRSDGLAGELTLQSPRYRDPTVTFETASGSAGSAELTSYPYAGDEATLVVTVDA
jgi:hypothetical protein